MKLDQLHQLINANKKLVSIKKPVKKLLKCILYSHTGKRILKQFEEFRDDLKHDLEIVFKPIKRFTKKDLKGVDTTTLYESNSVAESDPVQRGTHTLQDNGGLANLPKMQKGYQEQGRQISDKADDEFINWFDLDGNKEEASKNTKCTFTDKYGKTSELDVEMLND